MSIILRDYQKEAISNVISKKESGITKQVIALPCGTGKTVIFSALAKHFNVKTLVLAHRDELLTQAHDKFKKVWPRVSIGYCNAKKMDIQKKILIGSVASCCREKRLSKLKNVGIKLIIVDEAHHSLAKSYRKIINTLNADLLVGVTATPERGDKQALGQIFDEIVFSRTISQMIKEGWLCPVQARKISTTTNLDDVPIRLGDFALDELDKTINIQERNKLIVDKYKEHADRRKSIAFCSSVHHCQELAGEFKKQGLKAEAVYGDMPQNKRKLFLKNLTKGKLDVVTSCGVLTEGFDEPSVDCIIMARPTKSRPLYIQCIGRGLRNHPGKKDCIVLDFIDKDHRLRNKLTLKGIIPEAQVIVDDPEEQESLRKKALLEKKREEDRLRKQQIKDREINLLEEQEQEDEISPVFSPLGEGELSFCSDQRYEAVFTPSRFSLEGFDKLYTLSIYDSEGNKLGININKGISLAKAVSITIAFFKKNTMTFNFHNFTSRWFLNALKDEASESQKKYFYMLLPEDELKRIQDLVNTNEFIKTKAGMTVAITALLSIKRKQKREKTHQREFNVDLFKYLRFVCSRKLQITFTKIKK